MSIRRAGHGQAKHDHTRLPAMLQSWFPKALADLSPFYILIVILPMFRKTLRFISLFVLPKPVRHSTIYLFQ